MDVLDRAATLAPTPDSQPLEVKVRCSVDRTHRKSATHHITIHPDWSVTTPHDLELERITTAMGGYLSCIDLVDNSVPAARLYLARQLRLETPKLTFKGGSWSVPERVRTCCSSSTAYKSPMEAAAHLRSPRHIGVKHQTRPQVVAELGLAMLQAHGGWDPMPVPIAARRLVGRCVDRSADMRTLWEAGIPPELITQIHAESSDGRVLPVSFYFGVLAKDPDLTWVRETAAEAPDRELHDWLAWSVGAVDRSHPTRRREWLALGISRPDIEILQAADFAPSDVSELALGLRVSGTSAASLLAGWVRADCRATPAELIRLGQLSPGLVAPPSSRAVDRTVELLQDVGFVATRLEAALALLLCGSARVAAAVVAAVESLDLGDVAQGLKQWNNRGHLRRARA